jgi:uncharacterized NAD(P)/FAD-binding protein YdhS
VNDIMKKVDIAVVGGGFCGVMLVNQLILQTTQPLKIAIYDKAGNVAKGLAYATLEPTHLLNVPAIKMSAYPDKPAHFYDWLCANQAKWQALHADFPNKQYDAQSFVPRMIYGAYLEHIWADTQIIARQKECELLVVDSQVVDISADKIIIDDAGNKIAAEKIVLAVGHAEQRSFATQQNDAKGYLPQLWGEDAQDYWSYVESQTWHEQSHCVILGAGLSSVDAIQSLNARGFAGKITVISRHGLLPKPHINTYNSSPLEVMPGGNIAAMIKWVVQQSKLKGNRLQAIDMLRPVTNQLWAKISLQEKQYFLKHLLPIWSILRHRMPAQSHQLIMELKRQNRLQMVAASIVAVDYVGGKYSVKCSKGKVFAADLVINALGFNYNLSKANNALLGKLLQKNMIIPSSVEIGLRINDDYQAKGLAHEWLYAIGSVLFGERLEATAVPELRVQVSECAKQLLHNID